MKWRIIRNKWNDEQLETKEIKQIELTMNLIKDEMKENENELLIESFNLKGTKMSAFIQQSFEQS